MPFSPSTSTHYSDSNALCHLLPLHPHTTPVPTLFAVFSLYIRALLRFQRSMSSSGSTSIHYSGSNALCRILPLHPHTTPVPTLYAVFSLYIHTLLRFQRSMPSSPSTSTHYSGSNALCRLLPLHSHTTPVSAQHSNISFEKAIKFFHADQTRAFSCIKAINHSNSSFPGLSR
jgi:hypothetical protein